MSNDAPAGGRETQVHTEKRPRRSSHAAGNAKPFSGGYIPLGEAGREALGFYLARLRKALSALGRSFDADTIHDARVAVRGLRAMIKLLDGAPCFDRKQLRQYSRRLRGLAEALGDVRDMDVLLEHLQAYVAQHEEGRAGLDSLAKELRQRRRAGAKDVQDTLAHQHIRQLVKEMQDEFRNRRPGTAELIDGPASLLVRHFAGSAIWQRYQEILQYETRLADASGEMLHSLRIACKRLRYSMQIFGRTPAPLEEVMATLKAAQDHLGNLHDALFAQELIRGLMSASTNNGAAIGYVDHANYLPYADYLDALSREVTLLKAGIGSIWESLSGTWMRQTIAGFIASL